MSAQETKYHHLRETSHVELLLDSQFAACSSLVVRYIGVSLHVSKNAGVTITLPRFVNQRVSFVK